MIGAFHYSVGCRAKQQRVSLHAISYTGAHFAMVFTAPSRRSRDRFARGVAEDLGGYLSERFGIHASFELEAPVELRTAESQKRAFVAVMAESRSARP